MKTIKAKCAICLKPIRFVDDSIWVHMDDEAYLCPNNGGGHAIPKQRISQTS